MPSVQLDHHGRVVETTGESFAEIAEALDLPDADFQQIQTQTVQFEQDADAANIGRIYRKAEALQARAMETTFDPKTGEEKFVHRESSRRAFQLQADQLRQSAAYDTVMAAQRKTAEAHRRGEHTAAMEAALQADEERRQEAARLAMMGPLGRARENLKIK